MYQIVMSDISGPYIGLNKSNQNLLTRLCKNCAIASRERKKYRISRNIKKLFSLIKLLRKKGSPYLGSLRMYMKNHYEQIQLLILYTRVFVKISRIFKVLNFEYIIS